MKKVVWFKITSIFFAILLFGFLLILSEHSIRFFKIQRFEKFSLKSSSANLILIEELKKVFKQHQAIHQTIKYPSIENESVDYSKKFVPDILKMENQISLIPNVKSISTAKSSVTGTIIYKVQVTIDEFGRRFTPRHFFNHSNILFFGDSFTFGEGVNDDETYPYFISKRRPESAIYNLGVPGMGLNDILYDLEYGDLAKYKDIQKRKTITVYTYMNDHLNRFFCSMNCYQDGQQWLLKKANYDRNLKFLGSFAQSNSIKISLYKFFAKSELLKFLGINWPIRFSEEHFDTFARAIVKLKKLSNQKFGSEEFYFVFYPRDTSLIYAKSLIPYLKKYEIKYLIYEGIDFDLVKDNIDSIPLDHHPTAMAQYLTAYLLDRDLPK